MLRPTGEAWPDIRLVRIGQVYRSLGRRPRHGRQNGLGGCLDRPGGLSLQASGNCGNLQDRCDALSLFCVSTPHFLTVWAPDRRLAPRGDAACLLAVRIGQV